MPDEDKKTVDIDTSGPDATIDIEETKDESVVDTEAPEQEQGTDKTFENERETKLDEKKDDDKLEDYSKGVQARIAKLCTDRKMRVEPKEAGRTRAGELSLAALSREAAGIWQATREECEQHWMSRTHCVCQRKIGITEYSKTRFTKLRRA